MGRPNARSVMPTPRPPPRLTPRPRLLLMPGTDTTDVPAITVDTTGVDMEAMEATMEAMEVTDTVLDTDTDTDGANRPNQLHPRPTHPIIDNKNNQKNKYCHHHPKSVQDQTCIEKQNMYDCTIFLIVFFVQLSTQKYFCT